MGKKPTGRPRQIKTADEMEKLWEEYKIACDNHMVVTHEFSQKFGDFVTKELRRKVSYTIEGFCVYLKVPRSSFYATYGESEHAEIFRGVVARIRDECERDVREKFETSQIPPQLAALWMSKYGYGTLKAETDADNLVDDWVSEVIASDEKG